MKKLFTSIVVCGVAYFSIAQDNTLPTTGNIGIGTLNPTTRLDVNGNMKIDSSLVINDSLRVNKTIRVMDKVFIEGKTVMNENAVVKQNFKVMGNANFDGNATIDGVLKLPNTSTLSNNNITLGNFDFLLLNENGAIRKGSYEDFVSKLGNDIYDTDFPFPPDPINRCDFDTYKPKWHNGLNKIFTSCLDVNVGIKTETPRFALEVNGAGYFGEGIRLGYYEDIQTFTPAYMRDISQRMTVDLG